MKGHYSNNGGGGTSPKSGMQYTPLCRKSGFNHTMNSMGSRTCSRHKGSEKHNAWEKVVSHETGATHHKGWNPE